MKRDKIKRIIQNIINIVGFIGSIITILSVLGISTINNMKSVLMEFLRSYYLVLPFIPIFLCVGVHYLVKLSFKGLSWLVHSTTRTIGNELPEAKGTKYCFCVIALALYYNVACLTHSIYMESAAGMLRLTILFTIMLLVLLAAGFQTIAYLLYGYDFVILCRRTWLIPIGFQLLICFGWMVLVIVWGIFK